MSVTHQDFTSSGELQKEEAPSEISLRNAASRLYYGLFHFASEYAEILDENFSSYSGPTHEKLRSFFASLPCIIDGEQFLAHKKLSISLLHAHKTRCTADYEIEYRFEQRDYDAQFRQCQITTSDITKLLQDRSPSAKESS